MVAASSCSPTPSNAEQLVQIAFGLHQDSSNLDINCMQGRPIIHHAHITVEHEASRNIDLINEG